MRSRKRAQNLRFLRATVAVKEQSVEKVWVTRHMDTFCPRLFSAIRLPDDVLGSRSILVPLVRSGDPRRAKSNPLDAQDWPCDRRRLVDDLWALGLAHLPDLPAHDRKAAAAASLSGRNLDPWRLVLGVAHWLQHAHGVEGLVERMEALSTSYQDERGEAEDRTRVLFQVPVSWAGGPAAPKGEDGIHISASLERFFMVMGSGTAIVKGRRDGAKARSLWVEECMCHTSKPVRLPSLQAS
jgi:hypothetical protein